MEPGPSNWMVNGFPLVVLMEVSVGVQEII